MTKTQLIDQVAQESKMTKKQATVAVDAMLGAIENALIAGESVQISGLGSFHVKQVPAHAARNPRTNETVEAAASRKVTFSVSKTLKGKINET